MNTNPAWEFSMNASATVSIPPDQADALFPFHFVIDDSMNLVQLGQGLHKLLPDMQPGMVLSDHLEMNSPHLRLEAIDPDEHARSVFIFTSHSRSLRLKGQMFPVTHRAQRCLFFAVSPVVENMQSIKNLGLMLNDFAVHDSVTDLILLLQAQGTTLRELQALSDSYGKEIGARQHAEEELRSALDKAEAASKAKTDFLAMMSHEMRTPLNAVLGMLTLLQDAELDSALRGYVQSAHDAGSGLLDLIGDVLDLSKMNAGKHELEISPFSAVDLLNSVVTLLKPMAKRKGIWFEFKSHEHAKLAFYGDAGRLRQVLLNLTANALKFTDEGGVEIDLEVSNASENRYRLHFCVSDSGIGIPLSRQADLFKEFETLDSSYARRHGGTGLGLAISRRLVELMDGEIGFESAEGKGSRFWFDVELEACVRPQIEEQSVSDSEVHPAGRPGRVLLVEDVVANRQVAIEFLNRAGYRVDAVVDGREAVTAVAQFPYDVVLMDISMPSMDGIEATRQIRALPGPMSTIPIIAMTAHVMKGDRESFLAAGMNDYLQKPINRALMLKMVAQHVSTSVGVDKTEGPVIAPPEPAGLMVSQNEHGEVVDLETLRQIGRDTDPALVPELVSLFIDDARQRVQCISQALVRDDLASVNNEVHALGSSSATYGLPGMHATARRCEHALREQDAVRGRALAIHVVEDAQHALSELEAAVCDAFKVTG